MIIIIGPDHTGKTTLSYKIEAQGYRRFHFIRESGYMDYLGPLHDLELMDAVLDRHALCEFPYSKVAGRQFAFSLKEWHNLLLLTLAQEPLIILCTNKPSSYVYQKDQYLPYDKWDQCLSLYKEFLTTHHILYTEYDYMAPIPIDVLTTLESHFKKGVSWWVPLWRAGLGCVGSHRPKVLLVAERIGPNNMNDIPFETGPTGIMLSNLLRDTGIPLGKFAVTNLVKSHRRDDRPPNGHDLVLFGEELENLRPEKVVFMGTPAKQGIPVAKSLGIPYDTVVHLGYFHHRTRSTEIPPEYVTRWKGIMGIVPEGIMGMAPKEYTIQEG